jgi:hypothetical protein
MRTTIELPDELLQKARQQAAESGVSLKEFFISALERRLATPVKLRREPPTIPGPANMGLLSREEIDEAMFG